MSDAVDKNLNAEQEPVNNISGYFLSCARMCEFKKCCKKYKEGKRCKKCPKKGEALVETRPFDAIF